jgi:hypothetical protein
MSVCVRVLLYILSIRGFAVMMPISCCPAPLKRPNSFFSAKLLVVRAGAASYHYYTWRPSGLGVSKYPAPSAQCRREDRLEKKKDMRGPIIVKYKLAGREKGLGACCALPLVEAWTIRI